MEIGSGMIWSEGLIFYKEDLKELSENGIFDYVTADKKIKGAIQPLK
jgi:hypothetical protein